MFILVMLGASVLLVFILVMFGASILVMFGASVPRGKGKTPRGALLKIRRHQHERPALKLQQLGATKVSAAVWCHQGLQTSA